MENIELIKNIIISFLDIFSVSLIVYLGVLLISKSKKNVIIILSIIGFMLIYFISNLIGLTTLSYIISQVYTWGFVVLVIIFQQEIRNSISKIGNIKSFFVKDQHEEISYLNIFVETLEELSEKKTGALIAIENVTSLNEFKKSAINIDAEFSRYLLLSIFNKESPLHDGAVIIENEKIACASAYFPISIDLTLDQKYGTRHRAGLTISRDTDAIIIIVSEESGNISIAYNGNLYDNIDNDFIIEFIKEKMGV